jgi:hypothetical protein
MIRAGSISQRHGSAVPDPYQDVKDPQYCSKSIRKEPKFTGNKNSSLLLPLSPYHKMSTFDEEGLRTVEDS